jgi:hypothetical protein
MNDRDSPEAPASHDPEETQPDGVSERVTSVGSKLTVTIAMPWQGSGAPFRHDLRLLSPHLALR